MPFRGLRLARNYIRPIEQLIDRIDDMNVSGSFKLPLRIGAAAMPALAGSLFAFRLTPVFVLVSVFLLYLSAKTVQQRFFELNTKERYWHVSVPVHLFFIAWALLLALIGQPNQIGRSVGAMVMVSAAAMWPVYMGQKAFQRKRRKVPFGVAYAMTSVLVVLQQIIIIGGGS